MSIEDYRYIVTIANVGSFTNAAKKLFIARPSLSQRVKHIENIYGTEFFIRDSKGISLTAAGSPLCDAVQRAPKDVNGCIDRGFLAGIPFASGNQGSMLHRYLMSVVEDFREEPDVRCYTSNYPHLLSLAKAGIASIILYESFFDSKQEYIPDYYLDGPSNDLTVVLAWRKYGYLCKPAKNIIQSVRGIIRG